MVAEREAPHGVTRIADGDFAGALAAIAGDWREDGLATVMAGMIGSRQGWIEAPYAEAPADLASLAGQLRPAPIDGPPVVIVPGVIWRQGARVEVMRGEETQILGLDRDGLVCLPGTHTKWAWREAGRIDRFVTGLAGETFEALRDHSILGRLMTGEDRAGFAVGLRAAGEAPLIHQLFQARARVLDGRLDGDHAAAFLSGLLIGADCRAAVGWVAGEGRDDPGAVTLVGSPTLRAAYREALEALGVTVAGEVPGATLAGLARIARAAGLA